MVHGKWRVRAQAQEQSHEEHEHWRTSRGEEVSKGGSETARREGGGKNAGMPPMPPQQTGMITYLHVGTRIPSCRGSFGTKVFPGFAYHLPSAPSQASWVESSPLTRKVRPVISSKVGKTAEHLKETRTTSCQNVLCEKRSEIPGEGRKLLPLPINRAEQHWKIIEPNQHEGPKRSLLHGEKSESAKRGGKKKSSNNGATWKQIQIFHAISGFRFIF